MDLTEEQKKAYERFIRARDRVGLGARKPKGKWIRQAQVQSCVDIAGYNHPFYEPNPAWTEYLEASSDWWRVEPKFRDEERLRMSRGDYGKQDSWDERNIHMPDSYIKIEKDGA